MTNEEVGEFVRLFGDTPKNRILEFFLALRTLDQGIGDIADECNLSRQTAYSTMTELIKEKIIVQSRIIGRTQLYKLNLNNQNVKLLIDVFDMILSRIAMQASDETEVLVA